MNLQTATIEITSAMMPYLKRQDLWLKQRAMLLYSYIQRDVISHGKAAEILEMDKWSLIQLYGTVHIPFAVFEELTQNREYVEEADYFRNRFIGEKLYALLLSLVREKDG